jgi:hypothetical protein
MMLNFNAREGLQPVTLDHIERSDLDAGAPPNEKPPKRRFFLALQSLFGALLFLYSANFSTIKELNITFWNAISHEIQHDYRVQSHPITSGANDSMCIIHVFYLIIFVLTVLFY